MKHLTLFLLSIWLLVTPMTQAQPDKMTLTLQVRLGDGSPVAREEVTLIALPAYEAVTPPCFTDENGRCQWQVRRGLYEVRFSSYTLDDISALAVAEGGLNNFGITVGDNDITYAFTFQADGHVYFDAAPDSAVPQPIVPELADLGITGGSVTATPAFSSPTSTPPATRVTHELTAVPPPSGLSFLVPLVLGGVIGVGLYKFQVSGSRFQVQGSRFKVSGSRFQVRKLET